jgi:hypothetical protein
MILKYKVVFIPKDPRYNYSKDEYRYELIEEMDYCCNEMKDNQDYISYTALNGKLQLKFDETWADEPDWVDFDYCPWCGEKIIIEVVKRTKIIEKWKKKTVTQDVCELIEREEINLDNDEGEKHDA